MLSPATKRDSHSIKFSSRSNLGKYSTVCQSATLPPVVLLRAFPVMSLGGLGNCIDGGICKEERRSLYGIVGISRIEPPVESIRNTLRKSIASRPLRTTQAKHGLASDLILAISSVYTEDHWLISNSTLSKGTQELFLTYQCITKLDTRAAVLPS